MTHTIAHKKAISRGLKRYHASKGHWMAQAFAKHKGALHRELGVPADQKIPQKKLAKGMAKARKTGNTRLEKRINLVRIAHRSE